MNAHSPVQEPALMALAETAALQIAPMFPLDRFVATNPFLGHAAQPFAEAARELALTHAATLLPSREVFRRALAAGEITSADIAAALAAHGADHGDGAVAAVRLALSGPAPRPPEALPTAADLLMQPNGTSWSGFVIDQLSRFCAAHVESHDVPLPGTLLAVWRHEIEFDRSAAAAGLRGLDAHLRQLPRTLGDMLAAGKLSTGLPPAQFGLYLKRLLADMAGWAAFWRGRQWDADQHAPGAVLDLLAMRLGWDIALLSQNRGLGVELHDRFAEAAATVAEPASVLDAVMQDALENAWRREFFGRLAVAPKEPAQKTQGALHAVFCIDVRSEPLRRALEAQDDRISTGGFAGFFGLPLEVMGGDRETGAAHCPALIRPSLRAASVAGRSPPGKEWSDLLENAGRTPLTSLGFVETLGLGYAAKHLAAAAAPALGTTARSARRKPNAYAVSHADGSPLDLNSRTDFAATMLRGMGLGATSAPIVVLVGHSASTRNNAHAATLNCGACGGHSGEANAVVAAELLNDRAVRRELAARGMIVPAGTIFVPALHDTTSNAVTFLLDPAQAVSNTLHQAMQWFAAATRAMSRPAHQPALPGAAAGRSQDWSAIRAEWGLAGCAAFIAGPRTSTRCVDLQGTAFLHTYDWHDDSAFEVLEQILTAPLVVASWINLQYFAATRDNARFGGGNKLIHNVVAGIGVIEGAGGDLRPGLPMQSLHTGEDFVHTPLRLTTLIEAPGDAILSIIGRHEHLRQLLDNHWISLFRTENGVPVERYVDGLRWLALAPASAEAR